MASCELRPAVALREARTRTRSASIAWPGRYLELFLVHAPVGGWEEAVANCSSARRSSGPSGTGGSAADHRLTATCAARALTKTLAILDAEGADGAFIWAFADPWMTHSTDPVPVMTA